jgi:hypothetical protein
MQLGERSLRSAGQSAARISCIQLRRGQEMNTKTKSTHTMPGGEVEVNGKADDGMVNDSLGTIDTADSTGSDETKETGDAKKNNKPTRED